MDSRLLSAFILLCSAQTAPCQTTIDTLGNTIVEISVALDSTHFQNGYMSSPWDLHWGPDQKLWYTNKTTLCTYDPATQAVDTILSIPSGYIMAVATHGDFYNNPYVYLTIDTADYYGGGQIIKLFRYDYSLAGDSLYNPEFILQWYHPGEHSGGRVIYGSDDKLYVSTAEYWVGYDTLFSNSGKVLRINPDGTVPVDNPRGDYTFTYGHRNPQGIVQAPNGKLFVSEYGQQWDELNLLEVNKYYGWIIYDGISCLGNQDSCDYYDTTAVFPINVGMNPPSGIDYYDHPAIPEFKGLVQAVTGFVSQGLIVYTMNAAYDSVLLKSYYLTQQYGRVRDVCAASDGSVYFIAGDRSVPRVMNIRNPLFSAVGSANSETGFSISPNPASGEISIRLHSKNEGSLVITDLGGKNIYSSRITSANFSLNAGRLAPGSYFITVTSPAGRQETKKLFVTE
jgi:aldose sugar dehydrogenase